MLPSDWPLCGEANIIEAIGSCAVSFGGILFAGAEWEHWVGQEVITMVPLLLVLLLALILFGAGFALKALWWIAVIVLVVWLLGFVIKSAASGGRKGRWYRW